MAWTTGSTTHRCSAFLRPPLPYWFCRPRSTVSLSRCRAGRWSSPATLRRVTSSSTATTACGRPVRRLVHALLGMCATACHQHPPPPWHRSQIMTTAASECTTLLRAPAAHASLHSPPCRADRAAQVVERHRQLHAVGRLQELHRVQVRRSLGFGALPTLPHHPLTPSLALPRSIARERSKSCDHNVIVHPGNDARATGNRRCQTDDNGAWLASLLRRCRRTFPHLPPSRPRRCRPVRQPVLSQQPLLHR